MRIDFRFGLTSALAALLLAAPVGQSASQTAEAPPAEMANGEGDKAEMEKAESASAPAAAAPEAKPLLSFDSGELAILRKLGQRRQELDAREAELVERERFVSALEVKLTEQMDELKRLQGELAALEARLEADEQEKAELDAERVQELAKAYKAMKPQDAARLFDDLELELVTAIARELSPRTLAPMMSKMKPKRARELTEALRAS